MARTKVGFMLVGTLNGGPPAIRRYPLTATAYYEGQLLRLSSTSGSAVQAAAAATTLLGVAQAYVASADALTTSLPVALLDENNIFQAKYLASTTPRQRIGDFADPVITTGNCRLAGTAATANTLRIIGFHPDEAPTTAATGTRFYVIGAKSLFGYNPNKPN